MSLSEIARRFETTTHLIVRHAIRLHLPMNTADTRQVEGYVRHRNPRNYLSQNLEKYRAEWKKVIKKHLNLGRRKLALEYPFLYQWLKRNDFDWLEAHSPGHLKPDKKKEFLNWKKIDKELSKDVKWFCQEIRNEDPPKRVSITEIIKRTRKKNWLEKRDKKLPLTAKILKESLESLEDFMLRKLNWAEEKYIRGKVLPTRNKLICRAVIRNKTTNNSPKIRQEITKTLERIRNQLLD